MSTQKLEIVIGADVKGAVKGVEQLTTTLEKVEVPVFDLDKAMKGAMARIADNVDKMAADAIASTSSVTSGFVKLDKSIGPVISDFAKLKTAAGGARAVFEGAALGAAKFNYAADKTKIGANQATLALGNIGRIAQDLPFGFIGIANNLNPLIESFQRLKVETGSSKAAFSALLGSLSGAGGIGLAFSAVTAAISFASIGLQAWGVKNEEAADKAKGTGDVLKYIESQAEITEKKMRELTSSLVEQKDKFDLLTTSVLQYGTEIAKAAEIKALMPQVEEFVKKAVAAQIELNKLNRLPVNKPGEDFLFGIDPDELERETKRLNGIIRQNVRDIDTARKALTLFAGGEDILKKIIGDPEKNKKAADSIKPVREELEKISKLTGVTDLSGAGGIFTIKAELDKEKTEKAFKDLKAIVKQVQDQLQGNPVKIKIPAKIDLAVLGVNVISDKAISDALGVATDSLVSDALARAQGDLVKFQSIIDNYKKQQEILQGITVDSIVSIAEGIGNSLAGVGNPFGSFLSVIANGLQQLGKYLIQSATLIKTIKAAIKTAGINDAALLIGGAALVALGAAIRAKVGQTRFAEGGIVSGPLNAQIGEAGQSEVIMPLSRLSGILGNGRATVLTSRISGRDILLSAQREAASQGRSFG